MMKSNYNIALVQKKIQNLIHQTNHNENKKKIEETNIHPSSPIHPLP